MEVAVGTDMREGAAVLSVQDTGTGIPDDKLSAIFEPFYTTKAEGSGLGLWIVQQVVTAHGGAVRVANAPGGGAVFMLVLPLPEKAGQNG